MGVSTHVGSRMSQNGLSQCRRCLPSKKERRRRWGKQLKLEACGAEGGGGSLLSAFRVEKALWGQFPAM